MDDVYVSGDARARFRLRCLRCLRPWGGRVQWSRVEYKIVVGSEVLAAARDWPCCC